MSETGEGKPSKKEIAKSPYKSTKDHAGGGTSWRDLDKEDEVEENLRRLVKKKKTNS